MGRVKEWLLEQIEEEAERLKREHPDWDDADIWQRARENVSLPPKGKQP